MARLRAEPNLLEELFNDIGDPSLLWQVAVLALCVVGGWLLARLVRNEWRQTEERLGDHPVLQIVDLSSFERVLVPSLILLLLAAARYAFEPFMHVILLRVALPLSVSFALIRLAFYMLRQVFARQGQVGATILTFEKIISLTVWVAVALYLMGAWPDIFRWMDSTTLPLGKNKVTIAAILQAIVSVVILVVFALWAGTALERRLLGVTAMHPSLRAAVSRLSRALLVLVSVLVALSLVGIDLTVLSVFGGALGVGLGLGLQKIASNYVSGFVILLERSLRIGDMINVDTFSGKVTQINTRYTVLQALDGTETVLPNEMLVSSPVQNLSLTNPKVRIATQLTVAFDTDVGKLLPQLEQVCAGVDRILADPPPAAMLVRFGADGFELEVGMWIGDPENGRGTPLSQANMRIWKLLQEQGVSLPYATRDIRLVEPELSALAQRFQAGNVV